MKLRFIRLTLIVGILAWTAILPAHASLIAAWDFVGLASHPDSPVGSTPPTISPTVGSGLLDLTAFSVGERTTFGGAGTVNTFLGAETGTGTALALQNSSANGKAIIFSLNMFGYEDLVLTFATRGTGTGFNTHAWEYSSDGINYTSLSGNNTANTGSSFLLRTVDFSSISSLDNDSSIFIKLIVSGATGATGNNRFDNIQFNATPVPEPSTLIAGALLALPFGVQGIRYLRNRKRA